ncbi:MAG: hypothetical protein WKG07_43250 [Hymenobacter sp.]
MLLAWHASRAGAVSGVGRVLGEVNSPTKPRCGPSGGRPTPWPKRRARRAALPLVWTAAPVA